MNSYLFRYILLFCLLSVASLHFSCTKLSVDGGSGSTTTNGYVAGLLVDSNGKPASCTVVRLLPNTYDPVKDAPLPDSMVDTTSISGTYCFAAPKNNTYNLQAQKIAGGYGLLITGIPIDSCDTVKVPAEMLKQPGTVSVTLPVSLNKPDAYVYIPGTTFFVRLGNAGDFIPEIPAGSVPAIYYSRKSTGGYEVVTTNFTVSSGDTVSVFSNNVWTHSKKLYLNTSLTGANVTEDVTNFPLLIRLDSGNFDFSQAQSTGADIRFAKSDSTFLPYEIERWDAVNKKAEIWVKVDTIRGNDSTQSIKMYWGNDNSSSASSGASVFDTATGFAGVWHLDPPAGSKVPDATANDANGTATATSSVAGIIGTAQMFDGKSSLIQVAGTANDKLNFQENGTFSVSAWVKTNVLDSVFHSVVSKSNFEYGLQMRPVNEWEFVTYIDKSRWEMSRAPVMDYSWHSITGVRNGSNQYFYFDGMLVDSSSVTLSSNLARVIDQPLEIGHCPDGGTNPDRFFNGAIDEVRISRTALSAAWIKLCFMNQKEQNTLVKW